MIFVIPLSGILWKLSNAVDGVISFAFWLGGFLGGAFELNELSIHVVANNQLLIVIDVSVTGRAIPSP